MGCTICENRRRTRFSVSCTYKELRQSAQNRCPGCEFVSAWIGVWADCLNITESTEVLAHEFSSTCEISTDDGTVILDLFNMDSEAGECVCHYRTRFSPSDCMLSGVQHGTHHKA